jgi:hypothetical protein
MIPWKKLLTGLGSAVLLVLGGFFFIAVPGSKFGTLDGGRQRYDMYNNLRSLQTAELAYGAAFDAFRPVLPCPPGTPEPAFCDREEANNLGWTPEGGTRYGRYWVELDPEQGFIAHAQHEDLHYVVTKVGDPRALEP